MRTGTTLRLEAPDGLEPLGAFNQPVYRGFPQIRAVLLKDLGPRFADYFTRPDYDSDGKRIGWVANSLGEPKRWSDLGPQERSEFEPTKRGLHEGFTAYINRLRAEPENSSRNNFSRILEQALQTPDEGHLYFIDRQPMVTFWGFKREGQPFGVDPLVLRPGSTENDAPRAVSYPASVRNAVLTPRLGWWRWGWWKWFRGLPPWAWLLWLLGALLLLWLLFTLLWWLLAPRIGVSPPPYWLWPFQERIVSVEPSPYLGPSPVIPAPETGVGRIPVVPTVPAAPGIGAESSGPAGAGLRPTIPPVPSPAPRNPSEPQSLPNGGTPAIGMPTSSPPLPPPGAPTAPGTPLALPPGNLPAGPATFMQGLWRSQAGLRDAQGNPVEQYYRFDGQGKGDVRVRTPGGRECQGDAQALVQSGGQLVIREDPSLTCSDGTSMSGASTVCVNGPDKNAGCDGTNAEGGSKYKVRMEQMPGK
ncbi:MAG: hypothetical protein ROO76_09025 [Terriglobia bacterium]|nr:hypothetical protein [Terriglobia bacterium]